MKMMGKAVIDRYLNGYCCPGHDGTFRERVKIEKSAQRSREKRAWKSEWLGWRREYGA